MQVQGHVQEIKTKPTKVGDMYDLKVNGDYYGVGKYAPRDVSVGDYVEFVMEQNGNFRNVGRGTLRKVAAPANTPATTPAAPSKVPVGVSWDDKQATISKQAALNTAISMVKLAVDAGAINLGSNAAKGYSVLERMVMEQAARFHKFSTGVAVELPEAEAPVKKPRTAAAAAPVADEWDDEIPEDL